MNRQPAVYLLIGDMYQAISREKQIKAGSREAKIKLIESTNLNWRDLYTDICTWKRLPRRYAPRNDGIPISSKLTPITPSKPTLSFCVIGLFSDFRQWSRMRDISQSIYLTIVGLQPDDAKHYQINDVKQAIKWASDEEAW